MSPLNESSFEELRALHRSMNPLNEAQFPDKSSEDTEEISTETLQSLQRQCIAKIGQEPDLQLKEWLLKLVRSMDLPIVVESRGKCSSSKSHLIRKGLKEALQAILRYDFAWFDGYKGRYESSCKSFVGLIKELLLKKKLKDNDSNAMSSLKEDQLANVSNETISTLYQQCIERVELEQDPPLREWLSKFLEAWKFPVEVESERKMYSHRTAQVRINLKSVLEAILTYDFKWFDSYKGQYEKDCKRYARRAKELLSKKNLKDSEDKD